MIKRSQLFRDKYILYHVIIKQPSKITDEMSVSGSRLVVSDSLQPRGLCSPWSFPGQNTGVGSLSLLQGIFPTQGSNPGLPHCRQILYPAEPQGKPSEMPSGKLSSFLGQVPMNPVFPYTEYAVRQTDSAVYPPCPATGRNYPAH